MSFKKPEGRRCELRDISSGLSKKDPDQETIFSENSVLVTDDTSEIPSTLLNNFYTKLLKYNDAKSRIFNCNEKSEKKKIRLVKCRIRYKNRKILNRNIAESSIDSNTDLRPYADVTICGNVLKGLLDSGAQISCLGRNCINFVKNNEIPYSCFPISKHVRTASGEPQEIIGFINIDIHFRNQVHNMRLFLIPSLDQQLYLGTDFWSTFKIAPSLIPPTNFLSSLSLPENKSEDNLKLHTLSVDQIAQLERVKMQFPSYSVLGLGKTDILCHKIDVQGATPVKSKHYPVSPPIQKLIDGEIDRMLSMRVIEESNSPWNSPIVLVRKPNKVRLCLDSRKINSLTKKNAYPLPHVDGLLNRLHDTYYISGIDLKDAFWQISLSDESKEITAFSVPNRGQFQFRYMPFGLCNAAQTMSELMNRVIPAKLRDNVFIYLDDLLVVSATFEDHMALLSEVAKCLHKGGLTINVEQSRFCQTEIKYLGYLIGDGKLRTDPSKVEAVSKFPVPKTIRQLRSFLGLAGWYRRFVRNFSSITSPMSDCLKKSTKFTLTPEAVKAFSELKKALSSAPVLSHPDFSQHFYIQCDASSTGIGSVLFQKDSEENEHPIAFMSKKLNSCQRKYTVTELECYAAVCSVKQYRSIIEGLPFTIITDHSALKWLMSQKDLDGRLARWSLKLQGYNFDIIHRKGSLNTVPDTLSRIHMEEISCDVLTDLNLEDKAFKEPFYLDLLNTIEKHPDSLPDLKIFKGFVLKRTRFRSGLEGDEDKLWALWVPETLTADLIKNYHSSKNVGHPGISKTLARLREKYFWPKMANQVKNYIDTCQICKEIKPTNLTQRVPIINETKTERPFQRLYIDFMGGYPRTAKGNTHILTILDHFSKFVFLKPLTKASAQKVVDFLETFVFDCFGVPEFIHSDNGQQFHSKIFQDFLRMYGVTHVATGTHHPQANAVERVNRTILQRIRSLIDDNHKDWDKDLSKIECSLRSEKHSSTGLAPYFCVFGNEMILHGSTYNILRKLDCFDSSDINVVLPFQDRKDIVRSKILAKLHDAHELSKKVYNTRSRNISYVPNQEIYYRNFEQSNKAAGRSSKFAKVYNRGRIRKRIGNSLYEIENLQGKLIGRFPTIHLKL